MHNDNLVKMCLYHRYLYYVKNEPVITDYEYDMLEKKARKVDVNKVLDKPGSSLKRSYPNDIEDYKNLKYGK